MTQLPIRVPPETRWTCGGCGACCRGYSFGPVSERIIRGLEEADIGAHWPLAAEQPWYQRQDGPTGEAFYLAKVDDHCIFLRDDNLCAVHAALGPEAKPAFCREFPFHLVEDQRGLTAVIRADCKSWEDSYADGPDITAAAAEVAAMARVVPLRQFKGDHVPVAPGVTAAMAQWLDWEDAIAPGLVEVREPGAQVAFIREALASRGLSLAAIDGGRQLPAFGALLQALRMVMQRVLAQDAPDEQRAGAVERVEAIERVLAKAGDPLPELTEDAKAFLAAALRSVWTGRLWTSGGDVAGGLGRWLFLVTCARIEAGPGPVSAADFAKHYHPWRRFAVNRTVTWTLEKARPALVDLFLSAR
ncbi:MAG: YkgJ family cysteine cluster protein [Proteobacteria bacterium]|nr:YkgJ family cysteine cluster protein [Pseudomonadota bacterium]